MCSGIEAANVAWHPLGWRASWFAEIEPFPSAVLAHRWPEVPNLGDMTKLARQVQLLKSGLSPKSVNEIFTVVRGVWADAYGDGILKSNPLDRVKNVERDHDDDSADPFTREELELIAKVETTRQQDITMILFDCWAGLSVSELIGLGGMMWIWRQGRTSTTRARRLATS